MSAADRLEDSYPHGTVKGFERGCRGAVCPAGAEHGLSCRKAKLLAASDYRYQKLAKSGLTPAEIAIELTLSPDPSAGPKRAQTPVPAATAPRNRSRSAPATTPTPNVKHESDTSPAPLPARTVSVDAEGATKAGRAVPSLADYTTGLSQAAAREKSREVRDWCRRHGHQVPPRGPLSNMAMVAYAAAHPLPADPPAPATTQKEGPGLELPSYLAHLSIAERSDILDETRSRIAEDARQPAEPLPERDARTASEQDDLIDFADEVLAVDLLPWQQATLIRMLEVRLMRQAERAAARLTSARHRLAALKEQRVAISARAEPPSAPATFVVDRAAVERARLAFQAHAATSAPGDGKVICACGDRTNGPAEREAHKFAAALRAALEQGGDAG